MAESCDRDCSAGNCGSAACRGAEIDWKSAYQRAVQDATLALAEKAKYEAYWRKADNEAAALRDRYESENARLRDLYNNWHKIREKLEVEIKYLQGERDRLKDELERRTLTPAECEAITWAMVQADADRIATFRGLLERLA